MLLTKIERLRSVLAFSRSFSQLPPGRPCASTRAPGSVVTAATGPGTCERTQERFPACRGGCRDTNLLGHLQSHAVPRRLSERSRACRRSAPRIRKRGPLSSTNSVTDTRMRPGHGDREGGDNHESRPRSCLITAGPPQTRPRVRPGRGRLPLHPPGFSPGSPSARTSCHDTQPQCAPS